jgi:hypothetical protein
MARQEERQIWVLQGITWIPPFGKGGVRGDLKGTMLRYKKSLKKCSSLLRENMTEHRVFLKEYGGICDA